VVLHCSTNNIFKVAYLGIRAGINRFRMDPNVFTAIMILSGLFILKCSIRKWTANLGVYSLLLKELLNYLPREISEYYVLKMMDFQ
jgi:hypothetical protein